MCADTDGIFFCFFLQLNNLLLKDNINPIKGVYIVLFILPAVRGPPQVFFYTNEDKENTYGYK